MPRLARRTVAIVLGLMLGWFAAGVMSTAPTHAAEGTAAEASENEEHHGDAGVEGAKALVPREEHMAFYRPVVLAIIGLFVAAAVVGLIARSLGIQDPGIVAGEEDMAEAHHEHDDHGHGDHH